MDTRLQLRDNKKFDKKREKAFEQYRSMQKDFERLAIEGVLTHFHIDYLNEELDVDALTETQQKKLDNCKDPESREKLLEELPQHDVAYPLLYVRPYGIADVLNKENVCLDGLETKVIETINEGLVSKLADYEIILADIKLEEELKKSEL